MKNSKFLFLQSCVFIFFFILNTILMKFKQNDWIDSSGNLDPVIDAFYYTTGTHTSIGFGDIKPKSRFIKITTSIHMILVFILIILEL